LTTRVLFFFFIQSPISGKLQRRDVNLTFENNNWESFNILLKPIAVKRVAGSPEIVKVKEVILVKFFLIILNFTL
jgi:hypothetical protein